jgi:hypothetical protein
VSINELDDQAEPDDFRTGAEDGEDFHV